MSVKRIRISVKRHEPIENRVDILNLALHGLIPQFELAAPSRIPILIEVDKYVHATPQIERFMNSEVSMNA
jgi:hypothetical protein